MVGIFVLGVHGTPLPPGVTKPGKPSQIAIKKVSLWLATCLTPSLRAWVSSLELTRWKRITSSYMLSFDLHTRTIWYSCTHAHVHMLTHTQTHTFLGHCRLHLVKSSPVCFWNGGFPQLPCWTCFPWLEDTCNPTSCLILSGLPQQLWWLLLPRLPIFS